MPSWALFGLVFLTLYLDRGKLRKRHVIVVAVPYLIGCSAWAVYILENPADFIAQFSANAAGRNSARYSGLMQPWKAVWQELVIRYICHYGFAPLWTGPTNKWLLIIPFSYFFVFISCLRTKDIKNDKGKKCLLWLLGIHVFCLTFLMGFKAMNYMVYIVPPV